MPAKQTKEKAVDLSTVISQIEAGNIAPVYLVYGEDSVALNLAKRKLINHLIPAEFRDGNLNEFVGKGLDIYELITLSDTYPFLAPHRVILIENYPYLSGTKKITEKATAELDRLAEYITTQQATWTSLIYVFVEDKDKGWTISKAKPLVDAIKKQGVIIEFAFKGNIFKFLNALGERNSKVALSYLYQFFNAEMEKKEPTAIHKMISRQVRFWLQVLLLTKESSEDELPNSASYNINKQNPKFPRFEVERQARNFDIQELTKALSELVEIEDKLNPRAGDIFGEDPELVLESWIIKFCN